MARYLSKAAGFKKTVRKGSQTLIQGPQGPIVQTLEEPYIASFQVSGVTPDERKAAAAHFGFTGAAEGEDPMRRVSVWDSDEHAVRNGWDADEKERIEALLFGQQGSDYFLFQQPRREAPWPKYDELVGRTAAKTIADMVGQLGLSREAVIAYERENLDRPDVVAQLEVTEQILVEA